MKKVSVSVARRYARALLELALEQGSAPAIAESLREAADLLARNAELRSALLNPAVSVEKKKKIAAAVWGKGDALFPRLMLLLVERGRAGLVAALATAYVQLWNEQRGVVAAQAVSAVPLAAGQQQAIADAAKKLSGREVILSTAVDPQILGGVVLNMDGRTYDGSVRAQLQKLRAQLTSGGLSSSTHTSPR